MLASGFPPADQYILRTVKFVQYLPEFGWMPTVLTTKTLCTRADTFKIEEGVAILRVRRFRTPSMIAQAFADRTRGGDHRDGKALNIDPELSLFSRLVRQGLLWSDTPDDFIGWLPAALVAGRRALRNQRMAAVYASGPPFSVILAGALIAAYAKLPFVADFRDAWTLDKSDPLGAIGGRFRVSVPIARTRILKGLERWCLERAGAIVFTSRAAQHLYLQQYPTIQSRCHLIYNGADLEDFATPVQHTDELLLAHVGTLHDFQWTQVQFLLEAMARSARMASLPPRSALVFAGVIAPRMRDRLHNTIRDLGLEAVVQVRGFVPHRDAIELMRQSRVLIAFAGTDPIFRLSKLSEYIAAGPAILAFAPDGSETAREVQSYGGLVVDAASESTASFGSHLQQLLSATGAAHENRCNRLVHPHPLNRRTESEALARILSSLSRTDHGQDPISVASRPQHSDSPS